MCTCHINYCLRNISEEFSTTRQQNFILLNSPRSVVDSSFSTASSKAACANLSRSLSSRWWLVTTSVSLHLEGLSAEAGEDSREGRGRREHQTHTNNYYTCTVRIDPISNHQYRTSNTLYVRMYWRKKVAEYVLPMLILQSS